MSQQARQPKADCEPLTDHEVGDLAQLRQEPSLLILLRLWFGGRICHRGGGDRLRAQTRGFI